jgi:hypothetical protein
MKSEAIKDDAAQEHGIVLSSGPMVLLQSFRLQLWNAQLRFRNLRGGILVRIPYCFRKSIRIVIFEARYRGSELTKWGNLSALSSGLCVKVTMCFLSGRRVEAVLLSDEHVITVP